MLGIAFGAAVAGAIIGPMFCAAADAAGIRLSFVTLGIAAFGLAGVALVGPEQVQPGGLAGLDVGGPPAVALHEEHGRGDLAPERVAHRRHHRGAAERTAEDVEEARPAVGEREQLDVVVGGATRPARTHGRGRLDGAEGAPEGVRGDEDAHGPRVSGRRLSAAADSVTHADQRRPPPLAPRGPP